MTNSSVLARPRRGGLSTSGNVVPLRDHRDIPDPTSASPLPAPPPQEDAPPLDWALWWAKAMGVPVFPCVPGEKRPLHGLKWKDAATTVPEIIESWWRDNPQANIGGVMGNGLGAVDCDRKAGKDGVAALHALELVHGRLPDTMVQETAGGGEHHIFRADRLGNSTGRVAPGKASGRRR